MSRIVIVILIYRCHKPIDLTLQNQLILRMHVVPGGALVAPVGCSADVFSQPVARVNKLSGCK
jgi:hypothetical protein